ncbi:hypothetical protein CMQ_4064 [Grosmannia clavigera kw1407]|uniref:SnoRNA binding protein n=1 Tax=Grosmannia clavigera (strain kw1407 / UAMH 11150) TaxID=655863 RepID=F0X8M5_GROCL|nr:uncharacterized protein CMQ_4064 [Grosmannia clavigera kw1407]EFX05995.1 hypothetical protein CMQ_4064 [Grosmannia clavigera kw1407]
MPHSETGGPLAKRQKLSVGEKKPRRDAVESRGSNVFAPFRTVGLVSPTNVPFSCLPMGKTTFQITTSVGRALQTYDLRRGLNLVFVTRPQTPRDITATFSWKKMVFAAWGGGGDDSDDSDDSDEGEADGPSTRQGFWVFQRGRKTGEIPLPADLDEPLRQIIVFGSWIVGLARTRIEVWKSATFEHYTTLHPTAAQAGGNELTGGMCTMPTLLNKVFVGRRDGWVEMWNVSSGRLVYTILPPGPNSGAVTCLEPTPALCFLAIAYDSGPLVIQDVVHDKTLLALDAGTAGVTGDGENDAPVCSISFRTDGLGAGQDGRTEGVMATASAASGDVTFWDLNNGGRIMGVLRGAHNPPSGEEGSNVGGGISKVEFLPGQPVIVTSGRDNALKTWIFDETPFSAVPRVLHSRSGHAAPVSCLAFLPTDFDGADAGNKWLLSGGRDRSLWGWSLRRDGQSSELSQGNIRAKAKKTGILSASALRHGPTTRLEDLKAPEITCIASSLNRDGGIGALPGKQPIWHRVDTTGRSKNRPTRALDAEVAGMTGWESVVTAHKGDAWARTWFWGRKRAGRWAFPTGDQTAVSTVAISPCGSFALVGSAGGALDMYNLQSGLHRQRFPSRLTPAQARQLKVQQQLRQADSVAQLQAAATSGPTPGTGRHSKAVTGIVVDSLDRFVVSCSLDGTIKFWDLLTGHLASQLDWAPLGVAVTGSRYHAANDLVAFACDDNAIRLVDLETKKTIREFWAGSRGGEAGRARGQINDFCFSNDGRWVVAVTQDDARLRVWDLPTSHLVDSVVLEHAGRALAFSGTGEYLAVAPDSALGVHIFTNKTLFTHVPTRPVVEGASRERQKQKRMAGPTASGEGSVGLLDAAFDQEDDKEDDNNTNDDILSAVTIDQLSSDMTTLSLVPKSRWQTLLHLDVIKQRNKPLQAPKAPEKAPFFLGAVASAAAEDAAMRSLTPAGGGGDSAAALDNTTRSRILTLDYSRGQQAFSMKLHQGGATNDFSPFVDHLKLLPPAQADLELRSLASEQGELGLFVRALTSRLRARRDYELVQAWMAVFLRLHGPAAVAAAAAQTADKMDDDSDETADKGLAAALAEWKSVQDGERTRLDGLVGYCGGVVSFLRSPRS